MRKVNHSNLTVRHPQFNAVLWVTPPGLYKRRETWEFGCDLRSYREQLRKNAVFEFTSTSTTRDATDVLTRCNNLHEMYEQCKHQTTVCWTSLMGLYFLRVDGCCVILLYYFMFSFKQKQTFLSSSKTVLNPDASCRKKYYIHAKVKIKKHGNLTKTGVFLQPWRGFMKGSAHWEMCNRLQKCWFPFPYQVRVDCRIYGCLTRETNHQSSQRGDNAHPLQISVATEQFSSKEWLPLWVWLKKKIRQ